MKTILLACILAASGISARAANIIFVFGENAAFPEVAYGDTLEQAQQMAKQLADIDPVCQAVPQVCEIRYESTVYYVFYDDGTIETVYDPQSAERPHATRKGK